MNHCYFGTPKYKSALLMPRCCRHFRREVAAKSEGRAIDQQAAWPPYRAGKFDQSIEDSSMPRISIPPCERPPVFATAYHATQYIPARPRKREYRMGAEGHQGIQGGTFLGGIPKQSSRRSMDWLDSLQHGWDAV